MLIHCSQRFCFVCEVLWCKVSGLAGLVRHDPLPQGAYDLVRETNYRKNNIVSHKTVTVIKQKLSTVSDAEHLRMDMKNPVRAFHKFTVW